MMLPSQRLRARQAKSHASRQANMIGDIARTSAYRRAILGNAAVAFQDKLVIDLGAGALPSLLHTRTGG